MTRNESIEILKANAELVWGKFNASPYENKERFAEHAINYVISMERFLKNNNLPLFVWNGILSGYSEVISIQGGEKDAAMRAKYAGTAVMAMI